MLTCSHKSWLTPPPDLLCSIPFLSIPYAINLFPGLFHFLFGFLVCSASPKLFLWLLALCQIYPFSLLTLTLLVGSSQLSVLPEGSRPGDMSCAPPHQLSSLCIVLVLSTQHSTWNDCWFILCFTTHPHTPLAQNRCYLLYIWCCAKRLCERGHSPYTLKPLLKQVLNITLLLSWVHLLVRNLGVNWSLSLGSLLPLEWDQVSSLLSVVFHRQLVCSRTSGNGQGLLETGWWLFTVVWPCLN